ncbi:cell division protein FtsQ/DivIB [Flavobacterium sp.]|jgi:cell division protein FtsQ|uniref:cell division protein FtsQ/DivIB n=1 Tax=Flavobacterium sp. TaxID=239 RepID=UPI0037BFE882
MKKINWQNIRLVMMLLVLIFLYSFTQSRSQNKKIAKIQVDFQGNNKMFLTNEMVNNLLIQNLGGTSSIQKDKVDLKELESALKKQSFIENAEAFISEDGMLITKVLQKSPVARIVNNNRVLYVDKNGSIFQLSDNFSSRVPIVQGNIEGEFKKGFIETFKTIEKDDFLRKHIIAITIQKNGSMNMLTREHDYDINFGKPILIDKKFKNYKAFYQFASKDSIIEKYKSINLIFTQQVVCSK